MVQSYLVGVFFCVGLAVGVIVTIMLSTSSSVMYANVGLARSLPSANPPWIASDSNHSVQDRPPEGQAVTDTPAGVHNNTVMSPDGKVVVVHRPPLSHEEVDSIPGPAKPLIFSDGHFHKGKVLVSGTRGSPIPGAGIINISACSEDGPLNMLRSMQFIIPILLIMTHLWRTNAGNILWCMKTYTVVLLHVLLTIMKLDI